MTITRLVPRRRAALGFWRLALMLGAAGTLGACAYTDRVMDAAEARLGSGDAVLSTADSAALAAAIASPTRTPANVARDVYRNPRETLAFFGVRPSATVVELWPGGGWYTEILAPMIRNGGGTYYVAGPWERGLARVREWQAAKPDLYGAMRLAEFPASADSANPRVPDGSADVVLTFRNVHSWRMGNGGSEARAKDAFVQAYRMLKPGGVMGVVDHRLPETADTALEATSGYMKPSTVIAYAMAAGFVLDGQSEVNANPKDTRDHPGGVWALPPTLTNKDADRAKYLAIGESDRMTLRFRKPA